MISRAVLTSISENPSAISSCTALSPGGACGGLISSHSSHLDLASMLSAYEHLAHVHGIFSENAASSSPAVGARSKSRSRSRSSLL